MRIGVMVSLAASAVLGVGALLMAQLATPRAAEAPKALLQRPAANTTPVVVAASALSYGARLQAKDLVLAHLPADAVPAGAFSNIDLLLKPEAPVVLASMAAKEVLLPAKLSGPGARASLSAAIAEGMRAYSIRVNDVSGVGGHALPGDHVDVVLTREIVGRPTADDSSKHQSQSVLLIQDVRLLGVDLNADPTANKPATATTATLEVSVDQAQTLAAAAEAGDLSLALRRPGSRDLAQVKTVALGGPQTGAAAAPRRASRPTGRIVASQPRSVLVVQGDAAVKVAVAADAPSGT